MKIDLSTLSPRESHDLLTSAIIPRPIAWVSSVNAKGQVNLAPFSFFTGVTWSPPTICISVANRPDGTSKHTLLNIKETGHFVVNMVTEDLADAMVATSVAFPAEIDESQQAGITMAPSSAVAAPRIRQARAAMECLLNQIVTVGEGAFAGNLVLGTVKVMHVMDDVLTEEGTIDWEKLQVVGRLSGTKYCHVRSGFEISPPK